jgi:hypothetical protein
MTDKTDPRNEPKAKPDTGSIAPRDVCKGKPDRSEIEESALAQLMVPDALMPGQYRRRSS